MTGQGVVLTVLDGIGIRDEEDGNAFAQADTPTLDRLFQTEPYTELKASGEAVGLPPGYIGNSEVGHLHIGAGRIIPQELVRINQAIDDGSLFEKNTLQEAVQHAQEHGGRIHVMGIASDGGVHGHIDHMKALIRFFARNNCDVTTHAFLDGRDVQPKSGERYLAELQAVAGETGTGGLGSFMGRFYAMDRDGNWERTQEAYNALVQGDGRKAETVEDGLEQAYEHERNDYFIKPTLLPGFEPVQDRDVVVFANYRKDRARQLTAAFTADTFTHFDRPQRDVHFVSMKRYRDSDTTPVLFREQVVENTLGEVISRAELNQLRLSESQKEAHVTYFFDGQREVLPAETDTKIFASADVAAYDEKPEMEAEHITAHAEDVLDAGTYDFVLINYPNGDLVGHTGDIDAAVTAVETLDRLVARLETAAKEAGYTLILTADHGNCEEMVGDYATSHTLNTVPFCIVDNHGSGDALPEGRGLTNITATILRLLDVEPPEPMDAPLQTNRI